MGRLEPVVGTNIIITPEGDEIRLGHTWHEVDVLGNLISQRKPKFFIEVGIHEGGLSYLLLRDRMTIEGFKPKYDGYYWGIELYGHIVRREVLQLYEQENRHLTIADCFDAGIFVNACSMSKKIIYCDGGNKPKELLHFKSACNPDDLILTHDFWDGNRRVRDVPDENISKEVLPIDVVYMDTDPTFERLDENIFKETRIVGWRKL